MNKTNFIILSLVLCFSLVLVAYSLRVSADVNMTQEISPSYPTGDTSGNGGSGGNGGNGGNGGSGGGLAISNDISNLNDADMGSEPDPGDVEIGDTWTGPSGTTYELQEEDLAPGEEEYYNENGLSTDGVWVPVSTGDTTDNDNENDDKYACDTSTWTCSESSNGTYSSLAACQSNCQAPVDPAQAQYRCKQCQGASCVMRYFDAPCVQTCKTDVNCVSPAPTTKYSCNSSNWTCFVNPNSIFTLEECRIVCQPGGTLKCPGNSYCYACNRSTYQCYHLSSGAYSTLSSCQSSCKPPSAPRTTTTTITPTPVAEPCTIFNFALPARAWVGYDITGEWSASDWCEDCDMACTPYPACVWQEEGIGKDGTHSFALAHSGDYNYTLRCYGAESEDYDEQTISLPAYNLPWWREIIPVLPDLQGFLQGIWG